MSTEIFVFTCLKDNFGYLLHDSATGKTASIDAGDETAIMDALAARGWTLDEIFITHHHSDHTGAILPLKQKTGARVTGPAHEQKPIEGLDETVAGGDVLKLGNTVLDVIDVPGHTRGHIAFFDAKNKALFCGDALFSLGCGRMFEGTPAEMWGGLQRLKTLPDDTLIYCGHEYTLANARFALSMDPENNVLRRRADEAEDQLAKGQFTIPARLGIEKQANPFLRCDDGAFASTLGLADAGPAEIFGALRRMKDKF